MAVFKVTGAAGFDMERMNLFQYWDGGVEDSGRVEMANWWTLEDWETLHVFGEGFTFREHGWYPGGGTVQRLVYESDTGGFVMDGLNRPALEYFLDWDDEAAAAALPRALLAGDDEIGGGAGADRLRGHDGDDRIVGGAGDDDIHGHKGDDTCDGGDGDDLVRGGQGDDVLAGGAGDDHVLGDLGADTMSGGAGRDVFHVLLQQDGGRDVIVDFDYAGGDRIQVDGDVEFRAEQVGADVLVTLVYGTVGTPITSQVLVLGATLSGLPEGWISHWADAWP